MEEDVEVIFESWMLKLTGLEGRSPLRLSSQWKKRYFVLLRQHDSASLLYYNHKPKCLEETPKGLVLLEPPYKVEKKRNMRGQPWIVSLTTPSKRIVVAVDDEKLFHLFSFFLQAQTKLRDDIEDECFVVRPDNTEDQRKIGARGNICLVHVSPWGVTVALQLSKSVLAQWPLSCIRDYESTGHGRFAVTVGKRACMGTGHYVFNTRLGQENAIFDRLEHYVADAAGLRNGTADTVSQTGVMELDNLQTLTYVKACAEFSNHLRKISRDIYDSFTQHFGTTRKKPSSPDLVSDSPHNRHRSMNSRSASMATLDESLPGTPSSQQHRRTDSQSTPTSCSSISPSTFSSLPRNFTRSQSARDARARARVPVESIDSQYLHPESLYNEEEYMGMGEYENQLMHNDGINMFSIDASVASKPPTGLSTGRKSDSYSPDYGASPPTVTPGRPRLQRLQSRSCDDLIPYMEMNSGIISPGVTSFTNATYNQGDEDSKKSPISQYSTTMFPTSPQTQAQETRAAAQKLAQRRMFNDKPNPTHGFIQKNLIRQSSLKKALSNPNLISMDIDHTPNPHVSKEINHQLELRLKSPLTTQAANMPPLTASSHGQNSSLTNLPQGIHVTGKTMVFKRPSPGTSPTKSTTRTTPTDPFPLLAKFRTSPIDKGIDVKETHC